MKRRYITWKPILQTAAEIVLSYDTGVTLRQLFYRLVSEELIPNNKSAYKLLSRNTAEARRNGGFPALIDKERKIEVIRSFGCPGEAREWLWKTYRRDRTEGQEYKIYLGVEKAGIVEQLKAWFWDYGISIIALRGYSSQTFIDDISKDIVEDGRPAVLIYAGDFDPSGEDIKRDLEERCPSFGEIYQIALTEEQVIIYDLPEMMGKEADSRARQFVEKYGKLVQVELDALEPTVLRRLYGETLVKFMDLSIFEDSKAQEKVDVEELKGSKDDN